MNPEMARQLAVNYTKEMFSPLRYATVGKGQQFLSYPVRTVIFNLSMPCSSKLATRFPSKLRVARPHFRPPILRNQPVVFALDKESPLVMKNPGSLLGEFAVKVIDVAAEIKGGAGGSAELRAAMHMSEKTGKGNEVNVERLKILLHSVFTVPRYQAKGFHGLKSSFYIAQTPRSKKGEQKTFCFCYPQPS